MAEAVCVWDVNDPTRTTSPQLVLRGHAKEINALAALADGRGKSQNRYGKRRGG